jgi:AsmA family protein
MITIEAIDAALDRAALLQGKLIYESLQVTRPRIALERDTSGKGNWEFGSGGGSASATSDSRLVLVPKNRRQFPSLLNFRLTGGEVRFRTSSGKWLRLPLDDLTIQAADEDAPVSLVLDGGYNDTDALLTATTASFNAFRDASKPFDAGFSIATPGVKLDFKGVLERPLDFDNVAGRLALEARRLDDLIGIFDTPTGIAAPLKLAGGLTRNGDAWRLEDARGDIGGNTFTGRIALDEGNRGEAGWTKAIAVRPMICSSASTSTNWTCRPFCRKAIVTMTGARRSCGPAPRRMPCISIFKSVLTRCTTTTTV